MGTEVGIEGKTSGREADAATPSKTPSKPAKSGQHHGFGQELTDYIAPPRANGFTYSDLVGAFGY